MRGGGFSSGFVYLLAHGAGRDWHPGSMAVSRVWLTFLAARKSLYAPFLDPRGHQRACTGKKSVSRGEAPLAFNSGGDEASFTSGVADDDDKEGADSSQYIEYIHGPYKSI